MSDRASTGWRLFWDGAASQPPSGDAPTRGHPEWVRAAAEYVVQLANQQGSDDDEWDAAIADLEAALASPGPVTEVFKP